VIHGEFVIVAAPVKWKLASCASEIKIAGAIDSAFEVELNVPL
jgi:hypothetical protein